ncbi:hypothetical protein DCC39_18240 [Pueribacillus theae]|uniref:Glutamine amidotransferase type-2 domain-containing protein n=1 Tax=Pueribacillus theae TaxID=2171751 RepID=A0A2U1JJF8_9BACI|nr:hypothetical protein [Pueribacillus theae]PWA05272.1 hypothetical protein DCC39_18240 [Pueribacillus theae]
MCRLGGIVLSDRPRTVKKYEQITEDLLMTLVNMEDALGGDGNSLTFHYPNGEYRIIKEHRKVNRLFSRFNEIRQNLMDGAIIVQMHARLSTCGPSKYHENMHPFVHGPIIGCHNGQIQDKYIWKSLEKMNITPYSTTDSEAMFALMSVYSPTLRPGGMQEVLDELDGTYAITAVTQDQPNMLFMVAGDNPLCYWNNKKAGELWYASTPSLLPETLNIPTKKVKKEYTYGKNKGKTYTTRVRNIVELEEGQALYIRSHRKKVTLEKQEFEVWGSYYSSWRTGWDTDFDGYYEDEDGYGIYGMTEQERAYYGKLAEDN